MKNIPSGLQAHYDTGATALAIAVRITRLDGTVFAYTTADSDVSIGGVTYEADGLDASAFQSSGDLSVDNMVVTTLDDGSLFTRAEVIGGLWRNARFVIFRYCWADPSLGVEYITAGTFGEVKMLRGQVQVELRGLQSYLQQPIGDVSTKTCRNRLGDEKCRVNLATFTHTGTVTSVTDSQNFTDSGLTQAADYFGEGEVRWLTGNNTGQQQKIKTHATGGVLQLMLPMLSAVQVGDTFTAIAGCRKRHERTTANPSGTSDCIDKFNNVLNFGGEPHRPGVDALTSSPEGNSE